MAKPQPSTAQRNTLSPLNTELALVRSKAALALALFVWASGCKLQRMEREEVPDLPYPSCGTDPLPVGRLIAERVIRAGSFMRDQSIVERFGFRERACLRIATARVESASTMFDFEAVYDRQGQPMRLWRRVTIPGIPRPDGNPDIRRYELRTPNVTIRRRSPEGGEFAELRGGRPVAVVTQARTMLTPWLQSAHLSVGQHIEAPVLDITGPDRVQMASLRRDDDLIRADLGGRVRVYTLYGRDTVFADVHDVVVGDLNGLRDASLIRTRMPPARETYGGADPLNTP